MAKVKIGVIGVGSMGDHHARILSGLKEAKLIGVFDNNPDRAAEVTNKYGGSPFANIDELLQQVNAVCLVTPTSTHFPIAMQCLDQGVHLLVEKPMAPSFDETRQMVELAQKKKLILTVGMIERFNPAFKKAFSFIRHDHILGMDFKRYSPFPARISDASVVSDMMLHDIDLALSLSYADFDSVRASGTKVRTDRLDECTATVFFKDGLIARFEVSRVKSDKKRFAVITTDKAIYEVDLLNKTLSVRSFDTLTEKAQIDIPDEDQLSSELKDFLRSVDLGREPKIPGSDALPAIKIVEEVEKTPC